MLRKLLQFLGLISNKIFTGVLEDVRSPEEKEKDYLHEERVYGAVSDPFSNWRIIRSPYPLIDQKRVGSCVLHAHTLALEIERKNDLGFYSQLSKLFPYRLRSNYPGAGTVPSEAFDILAKTGTPIYGTVPNVGTESEAVAYTPTGQHYTEAKINRGDKYYKLDNPKDINTIAQIAQNGHGVLICIYANNAEWKLVEPKIITKNLWIDDAEVHHEICVLPFSGHTVNGKKYVTIQDSARFGSIQLRYVSEDFIKARCTLAGYWDTVKVLATGEYPKYQFSLTLRVGSQGEEVKNLQKLLVAEGLLPADCTTGYFGGYTLAGVRAFQEKYKDEILTPIGLTVADHTWGPQCRKKANVLCR